MPADCFQGLCVRVKVQRPQLWQRWKNTHVQKYTHAEDRWEIELDNGYITDTAMFTPHVKLLEDEVEERRAQGQPVRKLEETKTIRAGWRRSPEWGRGGNPWLDYVLTYQGQTIPLWVDALDPNKRGVSGAASDWETTLWYEYDQARW